MGLAYIAAVLEEKNIHVDIIDAEALAMTYDSLKKEIGTRRPQIIGISAQTSMINRWKAILDLIEEVSPTSKVILGGPHPSLFPVQTLRENPTVDFVVIGEGERTMLELVRTIEADGNPDKVDGIAYKKGTEIIQTNPRELIRNLDTLPFPARHLLPMDRYRQWPDQYKRSPALHIMASRGCPFRCTYCSKAVFGRKYRIRSPENVVKEIELLIEEYGAREVSFWDDVLTLNRSWVLKFCRILIERAIDIVWACETRVDCVDQEMLRAMAKAGCWNICYGIESGCQVLLDLIKKGITTDQIRNAFLWTKEAGIEIRASIMLALPGETPEQALRTLDFIKDIDPDYPKWCITTPYPGTELYRTAKKYGVLKENLSQYTAYHPVFIPNGYKDEKEIMAIHKLVHRRFYFRLAYFLKRFSKIESFEDIERYVKGFQIALGLSEK